MDKRIDHPRTGNFDGDGAGDTAARSGVEIDGADVELQLAADGLGNVVGHTGGVGRDDTDSDAESTQGRLPPPCLDDPVRVTLAHAPRIGTIGAMNGDAGIDRDEPEDIVALDGVAAAGQLVLDFGNVVVDN